MTCFGVKRSSTAYLDGKLKPGDVARLKAHVERCNECTSMLDQFTLIRGGMARMESPQMPPLLGTKLRVLASRERSALLQMGASRWGRLLLRWKWRLDEFMRPLTIPATGGILSSIALFATLAVSLTHAPETAGYEVPIFHEDTIAANLVPVDMRSSVVLTMSLDDKGHIEDYAVREGAKSYSSDGLGMSFSNISMPQFPTVFALARPITGDVRISMTPIVFRQ